MIRSLCKLLLVPASALLFVGCSSAPKASSLTLTPAGGGQPLAQAFPVGVADTHHAGDTDIVVTCRTEPGKNGATPAVQQTLLVRVLWQQGHVVKVPMREVSQNATFRWLVTPAGTPDAGGRPQCVEYTGTGMVEMARAGDRVVLTVREAKLAPGTVTSHMADPVGPATLTGTIVARMDREAAAVAVGDFRAASAAARTPGRAAEAKLPMGP